MQGSLSMMECSVPRIDHPLLPLQLSQLWETTTRNLSFMKRPFLPVVGGKGRSRSKAVGEPNSASFP